MLDLLLVLIILTGNILELDQDLTILLTMQDQHQDLIIQTVNILEIVLDQVIM